MRWFAFALTLLAAPVAYAQSCPVPQTSPGFTAGGNVFGRIASQWNAYFAAKVDANNGTLCNPTIVGTIGITAQTVINALGFTPIGSTLSGVTLPQAPDNVLGNTVAHTYFAQAYGSCTWDSTHDVSICINVAIEAANAAGGGEVIAPSGTLGQTTSLVLLDKVKVRFAGGANFGECGSILKWIGSAGGTQVTVGSDAAAGVVAGAGLIGTCLDGNALAATSIKWRSVNSSEFRDLYMYGYTANAWDIDVSATGNIGNMFNDVIKTYADGQQAASLNANVMTIGPGSASANTNRNRFLNFTGIYQNGKGIICGNADSNDFGPAHIETLSATPGPSAHLLGHASDVGRTCRSNRFVGEFGNGNIVASHFLADTNTFPSVRNELYLNHESGAPAWGVVGAAELWVRNSQGAIRQKRMGIGGDPATNNCIKYYGTTSGSAEICPAAVSGTSALTLPASSTGTFVVESAAAWSTYTPTVTCNAGTITTLGAVAGQYKQFGKTVHVEIQVPITTVGTCTGPLFVTLPVIPASTTGQYHLHGREDGVTGNALVGLIKNSVNANAVLVYKYDGLTCAASGAQCNVGGTYQVN